MSNDLMELATLCRKLVARSQLIFNDFFITEIHDDDDDGWFMRDGGERIILYRYVGNGNTHQRLFWIDKQGDDYGIDQNYDLEACRRLLVAMRKYLILEMLADI